MLAEEIKRALEEVKRQIAAIEKLIEQPPAETPPEKKVEPKEVLPPPPPKLTLSCDRKGCRTNTGRVCDSYCPRCRKALEPIFGS